MNETIHESAGAIWLCITTLLYFLMNGAQIFETFVVVPKWSANPPASLHLLAGKYGLNLKTFWVALHTLHELTFVLAVIYCWRTEIRTPLVFLFIIHFIVRIWTIIYFAPNIMAFQDLANKQVTQSHLLENIAVWRRLNYVRVGIFLLISFALLPVCIKLLHVKII